MTKTATGDVVGNVFAKPSTHRPRAVELGWHVRRDRWGRGIATEAAQALVGDIVPHRGSTEFVAIIDPVNDGSRVIAARLGMQPGPSILYDGEPHVLWSAVVSPGIDTAGHAPA